MNDSQENYYKSLTKYLFRFILFIIILKVFIENGSMRFFIPSIKEYEDILAFVFVIIIYLAYITGGLLTFSKKSNSYFYILGLNILGYISYYTITTDVFTKSFDYAEQLDYYSSFSLLFTIVTAVCTLGIFKEHFAKQPLTKKVKII